MSAKGIFHRLFIVQIWKVGVLVALLSVFLFPFMFCGEASVLDPDLPEYERGQSLTGNFSSIGSDTLNNLMTLWAEAFQGAYPNINVQVQGAGSSTAPPALAQGTANIGPMSREMRSSEIQTFEKAHGYPPTKVAVAFDVMAVYVHKDNPLSGLTIPQVDAIFSAERRCHYEEDIVRWGQLGLRGAWERRDFALFSRNAVSGTYGFFKQHALCDGDFKARINEQPGSASVVQSVSESLNAIGYSGIGYKTSGVRTVPLSRQEGEEFYEPTAAYAASGEYPLARFLLIYVNRHPNRGLSAMDAEFLRLVLSRQGQEITLRDGYIPLPSAVVERQRRELGLN